MKSRLYLHSYHIFEHVNFNPDTITYNNDNNKNSNDNEYEKENNLIRDMLFRKILKINYEHNMYSFAHKKYL